MSDDTRIPNISRNNEVNQNNQNIVQNGSGQQNLPRESNASPSTEYDVLSPHAYRPHRLDSEGRPVLIREPIPANGNLDTAHLFGELSMNDILGQGNAESDFSSLLETGQGQDGENIKKFFQSAGIPESALDATPPEESNSSGMGGPFGMRGGMGRGGGMDFMFGGSRGMGGALQGRGNGVDLQSLMGGGRGGGHILPPNVQGGQIAIPGRGTGNGSLRQMAPMIRGSGAGGGNMSSMQNMGGLQGMMGNLMGMGGVPGMNQMGGSQGMGGNLEMGGSQGMGGNLGMGGMPMTGGASGMQGRGLNQDTMQQVLEEERGRAEACEDSIGQGLNTIILFDNSVTMQGPTANQAKEFVEEFLQGLEDNSMDYGVEENVALITCGGIAPTVEQHLTNEYQCLRTKLQAIQTHGTVQLLHSLLLVMGVLERAFEMSIGRHSIMPRLMLVSNGNFLSNSMSVVPTMAGMQAGGGGGGLQELSQTIELLQTILKNHHMKLFFIPIGGTSQELRSLMQFVQGAKLIEASDLKGVTRTHIQHLITGTVKQQTHGGTITRDIVKNVASINYPNTEERDIEEVMELLKEDQQHEAQRQERRQGQMGVPNMGRGMMPNMGQGMMPNMGRGMPNMGQGMMPNMGRGMMPNMGQGMMPNMGRGMMPNMGQGMIPNMGQGMGPGMMGVRSGITPDMLHGMSRGMLRGTNPVRGVGSPGMQPPRMPGGGGGPQNNTNLQSMAELGISPGRGQVSHR